MTDKQRPPPYLYKYRHLQGNGLEVVRDALLNGRFKFSAPNDFNDPFDCLPIYSYEGTTEDFEARFLERLEGDPDREQKIETFRNLQRKHPEVWQQKREEMCRNLASQMASETGVFSLAGVPDDILMWSHYADCHKGVCLRFSEAASPGIFSIAYPIHYAKERPVVDIIRDTRWAKVEKALLTKSEHWSYEREWRMIAASVGDAADPGPGIRTLPTKAVDAVILGAKMAPDSEAAVRDIVNARTVPTTILRAEIDPQAYGLRIVSA